MIFWFLLIRFILLKLTIIDRVEEWKERPDHHQIKFNHYIKPFYCLIKFRLL